MRTVTLWSQSILLGLILLLAPAHAADRKPNIVLILADDLGWGDVGFNGRTDWKTPNLDRLAKQGTIFKRWYSAGVVCAPSRAALMTGRYGIHNGVVFNNDDLPRDEVTIADALRAQGYRTALFGKWHHGRTRPGETNYVHPLDHGFDEFYGYTNARDAWEHFPTELWDGHGKKPVQGYAATLLTDRAIEFVQQNRERPFFLYQAHIEPHLKIEAPEVDVAEYRGKFVEADPGKPLNATYAAMISRLDQEIGRLVKAIDDAGLGRDTLIVFTSDHGATFESGNQGTANYHDSNRPFRGHKRTLWEGGVRVPAFVRWTGRVPMGRVSNEIVHNIDVLPSFLAAVGAKPSGAPLDGANLLPVWLGQAKSPERTLFWEWRTEGYSQLAAMRGSLKLVITGNQRAELFNLEADPAERRNLTPQFPQQAKEMEDALKAWLATESDAAKWGK